MANETPSNGSKRKVKCEHKNRVLRVLSAILTCEETAIFCADCGKKLTKTKTDCR